MEPVRSGRSGHRKTSKNHAEGPERIEGGDRCSSGRNRAVDERYLEEAIRRCCGKFSLKLIDEIRVVMRKCESDAFMCQQEIARSGTADHESRQPQGELKHHPGGCVLKRENERSCTVDRTSPRQPLGDFELALDEQDLHDQGIGDDDDGDRDESVGESSGTPCSGKALFQASAGYEKSTKGGVLPEGSKELNNDSQTSTISSSWNRRSAKETRMHGSAVAHRLSDFGQSRQSREIGSVLKSARKSMLPRQSQISSTKIGYRYLCCGRISRDDILKEDTLDCIMGVLVLLNMIQLGFSADYDRDWAGWLVTDFLFAIAFLVEFMLKVYSRGCYHHFIVNWQGTAFDALIVLAAMAEPICEFIGAKLGTGAQSLTILRVLRPLRLVRIVKVLRLPLLKDLILLCEGLLTGSHTLFWSMILLMVPIFSSALLLRETVGTETLTDSNKDIVKPFTTLAWSFFTTFRCIMGDCASESGQPLPALIVQKFTFGWVFALFYVGVMLVTFLGVFNVITAIYVEQIVAAARRSESIQKRRRLGDVQRRDLLLANLIHVFVSAKRRSEDGIHTSLSAGSTLSGKAFGVSHLQALDPGEVAEIEITKEFFELTMNMVTAQNLLEQLEIPHEDRYDLFDILDADGSGTLRLWEIVEGMKKLRGEPRRSDVVSNGLTIRALQKRVHSETESIFTIAKKTADNVEYIRQDYMENTDLILDKLGALAELLGGAVRDSKRMRLI